MSLLSHFQPKHLHHAYCVIGDVVAMGHEIESHLKSILDDSYALEHFHHDRFKIDDVVELRLQASQHGNKVFIIEIAFAMREAQNALLKTIEEPAPGTHFILCVPSEQTLLPTILSRCEKITEFYQQREVMEEKINVEDFLKQSKEDRLNLIKKDNENWTNEDILNFINNLEYVLHTDTKSLSTRSAELEILERLKGYLSSPSASVSMIMEMIALIV